MAGKGVWEKNKARKAANAFLLKCPLLVAQGSEGGFGESDRWMSEPSHKKIVKADRGLRKRAVVIFVGTLIVGLVLLHYVQTFLQDVDNLVDVSPQRAMDRLLTAFRLVMIAMVLGFVAFALYLLRLSFGALRSQQFPPPGIGLIKNDQILTGEKAKIRGIVGLAMAAALAAFGLLLALYVYRMIQTFMTTAVCAKGA